jgi:hypothetical protein
VMGEATTQLAVSSRKQMQAAVAELAQTQGAGPRVVLWAITVTAIVCKLHGAAG